VQKGFVARRYLAAHVGDSGNTPGDTEIGSYSKELLASFRGKEVETGEKAVHMPSCEKRMYEELDYQTLSQKEKGCLSSASSLRSAGDSALSVSEKSYVAAATTGQQWPTGDKSPRVSSSNVSRTATSNELTSTDPQGVLAAPPYEAAASSAVDKVSLASLC